MNFCVYCVDKIPESFWAAICDDCYYKVRRREYTPRRVLGFDDDHTKNCSYNGCTYTTVPSSLLFGCEQLGYVCKRCASTMLENNESLKTRGGVKHKHNWLKYVGFTHTYEYCECGEKQ